MKNSDIFRLFAAPVRRLLEQTGQDMDKVQEIRMRVQLPVMLKSQGKETAGSCGRGTTPIW